MRTLDARDEAAAAAFRRRLAPLVTTVPSEGGNLSYQAYATVEDATLFYLLEAWKCQADLDRYIAKNEADGVNDGVADLLAGPPETTTIIPLGTDREANR